jgi:hypothetical protein
MRRAAQTALADRREALTVLRRGIAITQRTVKKGSSGSLSVLDVPRRPQKSDARGCLNKNSRKRGKTPGTTADQAGRILALT